MLVVLSRIFRSFSLFFFKQKAAYDVRISDWSSDVCFSDLRHALLVERQDVGAGLGLQQVVGVLHPFGDAFEGEHLAEPVLGDEALDVDRKSVVTGKRVSVRVDLGGRRCIKKKSTRYDIDRARHRVYSCEDASNR